MITVEESLTNVVWTTRNELNKKAGRCANKFVRSDSDCW